jgi:hypothetical protein
MRKEYDLKALKVKRRGPLAELKAVARRTDVQNTAEALKKTLLNDRDFIRKVAAQVGR